MVVGMGVGQQGCWRKLVQTIDCSIMMGVCRYDVEAARSRQQGSARGYLACVVRLIPEALGFRRVDSSRRLRHMHSSYTHLRVH